MNQVSTEAFFDELEKIGASKIQIIKGVGTAAGAALAGAAVYDFVQGGRKMVEMGDIKEQLQKDPISDKMLKGMIKRHEQATGRKVGLVREQKDVKEMVAGMQGNVFTRHMGGLVARTMLWGNNNAAVVLGKGDTDYAILPKKISPVVVAHELGHLNDFRGKDRDKYEKYFEWLVKGQYEKGTMARERKAWDLADTYTDKDKAELMHSALSSYEGSFHLSRGALSSAALYAGHKATVVDPVWAGKELKKLKVVGKLLKKLR